jgi:hypothetical protein
MGRPYPNRRRKRPGRRPPHRYRGGSLPVRPNGFTDFGLRHVYDLLMPHIRGRDRRLYFNRWSAGYVLVAALGGAVIGQGIAGPIGAIIGFLVGGECMGRGLIKHRFYRP